jgi:hypothetical protein
MTRPNGSIVASSRITTPGIGGFENIDVLLEAVKRSMSPPIDAKDEPLGMLQDFEIIQNYENIQNLDDNIQNFENIQIQ